MNSSDKETMQLEPELRALLRLSEWTEAQARRVLQAQEHSGLTVQVFARRVGIASWRLYKWRQRLRRVDSDAAPQADASLPPQFVPVQLHGCGPEPAALGAVCAELLHPSGWRLRLTDTTPTAWLQLLSLALPRRYWICKGCARTANSASRRGRLRSLSTRCWT